MSHKSSILIITIERTRDKKQLSISLVYHSLCLEFTQRTVNTLQESKLFRNVTINGTQLSLKFQVLPATKTHIKPPRGKNRERASPPMLTLTDGDKSLKDNQTHKPSLLKTSKKSEVLYIT